MRIRLALALGIILSFGDVVFAQTETVPPAIVVQPAHQTANHGGITNRVDRERWQAYCDARKAHGNVWNLRQALTRLRGQYYGGMTIAKLVNAYSLSPAMNEEVRQLVSTYTNDFTLQFSNAFFNTDAVKINQSVPLHLRVPPAAQTNK